MKIRTHPVVVVVHIVAVKLTIIDIKRVRDAKKKGAKKTQRLFNGIILVLSITNLL